MLILIIGLGLSVFFVSLFLILTLKYKSYLENVIHKREKEEKEKSLEELLERYVVEEKKDIMKDKLSKISAIIQETEKEIESAVKEKVKFVEDVKKTEIKAKGKEELKAIEQANMEYSSFEMGFRSAMPETEEERIQDMAELKNAISMLESFDAEHYEVGPKKIDAGVGMFYDRMSRRFKKIIAEHKLDEHQFIPIQRLKYHVFQNVRNIKNSDILPILKIMQDTNLLKNIIEINPTFQLIVFTDKKIKFNMPEKVLLTFAYDEGTLTIKKLKEITEWKESYAKKILKGLENKEIITVLDENISVDGFGHEDERKTWNQTIEEQIQAETKKEEEKRRRQQERQKLLRKKLAETKKAEVPEKEEAPEQKKEEEIIESIDEISAVDEEEPPKKVFKSKPTVKSLPKSKPKPLTEKEVEVKKVKIKEKEKPKKKSKEIQEIKDKDDLLGAMDALDDIMPTVESEDPKKTKDLKGDLQDALGALDGLMGEQGDQEEEEIERDLEDLVPEKILNYHEKYSLLNGGFVQYTKIKEFVDSELEDVPEDLIKAMLGQLKELMMIQDVITIGKEDFYLFNPMEINEEEIKFIEFAINKKPMKKKEIMEGLEWEEEDILNVMKSLQAKGVLRIEKDKVLIPGIKQE